MRELTEAEAQLISGGSKLDLQLVSALFNHKFHKEIHAEVESEMSRVVKELQDSMRVSS